MHAIIANVLPEYVRSIDPNAAIATAKNGAPNEIVIVSENSELGRTLGMAGIHWREL